MPPTEEAGEAEDSQPDEPTDMSGDGADGNSAEEKEFPNGKIMQINEDGKSTPEAGGEASGEGEVSHRGK